MKNYTLGPNVLTFTSGAPGDPYRYSLNRLDPIYPESRYTGSLYVCMLNPSTADSTRDDPTIRRCVGFARREGRVSLFIVNLFALRATDPKMLMQPGVDPVGPKNSEYVRSTASMAAKYGEPMLCAWGAFAEKIDGGKQARETLTMFAEIGVRTVCLGTTKNGSPQHPLYVRGDQPLVDFPQP